MTVTNENSRNDYISNGSAVTYAFTFKVLNQENIQVIIADLNGVESILVLGVGYTVALDADTGLGTITLTTAATVNYTISLLRNMDFEQNTSIQNQGSSQFSGKSFEQALDKSTLLSLQLKESIARAILLPKSSLLTELEIPVNLANAGKAIIVNPAGDNLEVKNLADISAAAFSALGLSLVAAETAAAMRTLLSAQALNANLTALSGLTGAANKVPYFTGLGALGLSDLPANRNAIINGDFNIWQRGTSFVSIADATYNADRFYYNKSGAMVHDVSRSTDVPTFAQANRGFNYSTLVDCQTVDAAIGATDLSLIGTAIEGFNFLPLAQKPMTLSFWVKATKIGIYCVALTNNADRSYVAEYTINAADTWEYKTITIAASPNAGTWNYTNGVGLRVNFALAIGANSQTTKDAWQTGLFYGTSNQVNACDNIANNFRITGLQLEAGSVATPFEQRSIQQELALCLRYAWALSLGTSQRIPASGLVQAVTNGRQNIAFPVQMRVSPTLNASNISDLRVFDGGSAQTAISVTSEVASIYGNLINFGVASGLTVGRCVEVFSNAGTAALFFNAEL
jgi:hypothetical protein